MLVNYEPVSIRMTPAFKTQGGSFMEAVIVN